MDATMIWIFSSVVALLFAFFIYFNIREFIIMDQKPFEGGPEKGPRASLLDMIGRMME